jgi:cAMP-dependent protein kinase regulator
MERGIPLADYAVIVVLSGDTFFFVEEGEAEVTKTHQGDNGETLEIGVGVLSWHAEIILVLRLHRPLRLSCLPQSFRY